MSHTQAILFDRSMWTEPAAEEWLQAHDFWPIKPAHTTKNKLRYRIRDPTQFSRMRTISANNVGIEFVLGWV